MSSSYKWMNCLRLIRWIDCTLPVVLLTWINDDDDDGDDYEDDDDDYDDDYDGDDDDDDDDNDDDDDDDDTYKVTHCETLHPH